jgi:ribosomal protein S18 acetylase RimI-like enzyme
MRIRDYTATDRPHLHDICLRTGDLGRDATATASHPQLLGDYYAVPYAEFDPKLCLILADDAGPCGYILGTANSQAFSEWFNRHWLPVMRVRYRNVKAAPGAMDAWLLALIRHDQTVPDCAQAYPAHLHIDILPRAQGGGWGRRLFGAWTERAARRGATGVHLGVAKENTNAVRFYERLGMQRLADLGGARIYGLPLDPPLSST